MRLSIVVSMTLILVIVLSSACAPRSTEGLEATAQPTSIPTSLPATQSTSQPAAAATTATPLQTVIPTVAPVEASATSVATAVVFQPTAELSASEVEALHLALQDEYKALATYERVMADFGTVTPFESIAGAEEQHIAALKSLFVTYGLEVPTSDWAEKVASYSSVVEACKVGVEAEIENAALYDRLFAMVEHADIIQVFESLQAASQEQHLPSFERCANR